MAAGSGMIIEQDGDDVRILENGFDAVLMDQQIATARRYPRGSIGPITENITAMVTYSDEVAAECVYAVPRGGKSITGPSVRFAEAVASCWGNSEHGAKIVEIGDEFVTAQAAYRDLERNIRIVIEAKRPIVDSNGNRYKADMIGVTSNAAMSIALRNAILKGVPKMAWGPAFDKAFAMIAGTFESLEKRRTAALDAFKKLGVEQDMVLQIINAKSAADIQPEDMIVLRGTLQAIKDGDTTVRAVFGNMTNRKAAEKADVGGHLDKGKANGNKANETKSGGKTADAAKPAVEGPAPGGGEGGNGSGDANGNDNEAGNRGGGEGGDEGGRVDPSGESPAAATDGGSGAGDAGGSGGGAPADASGASENATDVPGTIAEEFAPFLDGFEGAELSKLTNAARSFSGAATSVKVAGIIAEFQPVFESASDEAATAFNKMAATANKLARKGGAKTKL